MKWYPVQTTPGREDSSIATLKQRLRNFGLSTLVGRVEAPTREVKDLKDDGTERIRQKRLMPGYILVEARMTNDLWSCIIGTPGLNKVSRSEQPQPLGMHEVAKLLDSENAQPETSDESNSPSHDLREGDTVEVVSGPLAGYDAEIAEVHKDRIRVNVSFFDREVPIDIEANQLKFRHRVEA